MWVRPQTHIKTSLELKMTCLRVSAASSRATLAASPRLWLNPPSFSYISLPSHSRGCVINMKPCVTAVNRGSSFPDHPHRNVWPHGGLTRRPNLGAHGAAAFYPTLNRTLSSHRWLLVRLHGEQAPCSSPFSPFFSYYRVMVFTRDSTHAFFVNSSLDWFELKRTPCVLLPSGSLKAN